MPKFSSFAVLRIGRTNLIMREDLRESSTQFPGLQIFTSWKSGSPSGRGTPKFASKPSFNSFYFPSEETLASATQNDNLSAPQAPWLKFTDRRSTDLHDYSPTVVGSESFDKFDLGEKTQVVDFWTGIIEGIFKDLCYDNDGQFHEEFQYVVISSDFLNDPEGFRFSFTGKKSIMDFHKSSQVRKPWTTIPTKYGRLTVSLPSKFLLRRTFNYSETILLVLRVLRGLNRLKRVNERSGRIVATLLIVTYLAIQQNNFHAQYTRYKALLVLKAMLTALQELSALSHMYQIKLKELRIYKPLTTSIPNCGLDTTISKIGDLLSSCLDLLFYRLKVVIQHLIHLCSTASLAKYCDIYNLEMSDLFHYFSAVAIEVEEKVKRVHIAKKFMLCTLLSFDYDSEAYDTSMGNFLSKAFPDYDYNSELMPNIDIISKYTIVTENIQNLKELVVQLTSSLKNHKSVLFATGETPPESVSSLDDQYNVNGPCKNRQLYITLHSLRKLENTLIASENDEISPAVRKTVRVQLKQLLSMWQSHDTNKADKRLTSIPSPNPGFSLDVLKRRSSQFTNRLSDEEKPRLRGKVSFEQVDETHSDIEYDFNFENREQKIVFEAGNDSIHPEYTAKAGLDATQKDQQLRGLSDEELRRKLDERISKFAVENRKGRDKLRTQKSFELLKQQKGKSTVKLHRQTSIMSDGFAPDDKSRSPHQPKLSSEDSIPVLYELEELLETRQ